VVIEAKVDLMASYEAVDFRSYRIISPSCNRERPGIIDEGCAHTQITIKNTDLITQVALAQGAERIDLNRILTAGTIGEQKIGDLAVTCLGQDGIDSTRDYGYRRYQNKHTAMLDHHAATPFISRSCGTRVHRSAGK